MREPRLNLLHLLIIRWLVLANAVLVYMADLNAGPFILFVIVSCYSLLLTVFWRKVTVAVDKYSYLAIIDITFSAVLVWATGGTWSSPYFAFSLASLMIASVFLGFKQGLLATAYFIILFTAGFTLINKEGLETIIGHGDLDALANTYAGIFLIAIFFGYPAHIIRRIDSTKSELIKSEAFIDTTKGVISAISNPTTLSCRELDVLASLATGKTNLQIADELHVSEKTVKNHLYRIYKKLGISSREEAIIYFHNHLA